MRFQIVQAPAPMREGQTFTATVIKVFQGPEDLVPTAYLKLEHPVKDWYEAFADEVHRLGKSWPDVLTEDEERQCEEAADKVATRPEAEQSTPDHPTIAP